MIVIDASLATKWFLMEAESSAADAFLADHEADGICGPDLLAIEVSRAIVAAVNARRIDPTAGRDAVAAWLESIDAGRIEVYRSTSDAIARSVAVALRLGHPLSDCIYLTLAMDRGLDLVTCDAKFQRKTIAVYPRVRLLGEVSAR